MKSKVCHITSVHPRNDIRIFQKECKSIKNAGFEVNLVVADGFNDAIVEGINIYDVGREKNRRKRILKTPRKVYRKALQVDADIYHFHDPELLFTGLKLLRKGKKVIYDTHEDLPRQIYGKPYLNKIVKPILAFFFEMIENYASHKFSFIITATPKIKDRFLKINKNTVDINNYPLLGELQTDLREKEAKNQICYVGGITKIRGLKQLVDSMQYVDTVLMIAGDFENEELKKELQSSKGWPKVVLTGFLNREQLKDLLRESKAGMVTFLPLPNHVNAQPNKIFEYMSAGLPVIGSNFDLWKQIIEENRCGICVNPEDPEEIAKAVETLILNEELMKEMGVNGQTVVKEKYNWQKEEIKLLEIYNRI